MDGGPHVLGPPAPERLAQVGRAADGTGVGEGHATRHPPAQSWLLSYQPSRAEIATTLAGAAGALALLGLTDSLLSAAFAALWWVLVVIIVRSDLESFVIPDQASLSIAVLGLVYVAATADSPDPVPIGWAVLAALANGIAAFGIFWLIGSLYRRRSGREGLGFGDVKLAGASALWLSAADGVVALEIAALSALFVVLVRHRGAPVRTLAIPFGAFLAPAAWLVFVAGPWLRMLLDR